MNKGRAFKRILIIILCLILIIEAVYIFVMHKSKETIKDNATLLDKIITDEAEEVSELARDTAASGNDEAEATAQDGNEAAAADETAMEIDIKRNSESVKWEADISKIEGRYGADLPKGRVVFYGSSSIRKWKTLEEDMSELDVLNHGFGGAMTGDCLYYADRMIVPFEPAAIVYYAGTNDIGKGRDVETTYQNTIDFIKYIHKELPDTRIFYIEQTHQPERDSKWPLMQELNARVKEYSAGDDLITYIETSDVLNNADGSPRYDLFVEDGIHFNSAGYEAWASLIRPVLYAEL